MLRRVVVGAGQADAPPGELGVGGPHLLPVQHPPAVDRRGGGAQAGQVAPRIGLAEQLAPDLLGGEDRADPALLLVVGAVGEQGRSGQVDADPVDRLGRAGPGVLGVEDGDVDRRRAPPAELVGPVDADPPPGGELRLPAPDPTRSRPRCARTAAAARGARRARSGPRPRTPAPPVENVRSMCALLPRPGETNTRALRHSRLRRHERPGRVARPAHPSPGERHHVDFPDPLARGDLRPSADRRVVGDGRAWTGETLDDLARRHQPVRGRDRRDRGRAGRARACDPVPPSRGSSPTAGRRSRCSGPAGASARSPHRSTTSPAPPTAIAMLDRLAPTVFVADEIDLPERSARSTRAGRRSIRRRVAVALGTSGLDRHAQGGAAHPPGTAAQGPDDDRGARARTRTTPSSCPRRWPTSRACSTGCCSAVSGLRVVPDGQVGPGRWPSSIIERRAGHLHDRPAGVLRLADERARASPPTRCASLRLDLVRWCRASPRRSSRSASRTPSAAGSSAPTGRPRRRRSRRRPPATRPSGRRRPTGGPVGPVELRPVDPATGEDVGRRRRRRAAGAGSRAVRRLRRPRGDRRRLRRGRLVPHRRPGHDRRRRAGSPSSVASRTSSSGAARTSPPWRSRACSRPTPRCARRSSSASPTCASASGCAPSSCSTDPFTLDDCRAWFAEHEVDPVQVARAGRGHRRAPAPRLGQARQGRAACPARRT